MLYRKLMKQIGLSMVATVTLQQVACTTDQLSNALLNEVAVSASTYTFEVAQTIFMNLFQL